MARPYFLRPLTGALLGLVLSLFISSWAVADPLAATYSFTILEVPGATSTHPTSINNSCHVAGYYSDGSRSYGFVYSNGTFTTLDPPGATFTNPLSINDSGQVVGSYFGSYSDGSPTYGFIATPMVTDIPTLSQWALLLGGGLLVGMALLAQVRRTRPLRG